MQQLYEQTANREYLRKNTEYRKDNSMKTPIKEKPIEKIILSIILGICTIAFAGITIYFSFAISKAEQIKSYEGKLEEEQSAEQQEGEVEADSTNEIECIGNMKGFLVSSMNSSNGKKNRKEESETQNEEETEEKVYQEALENYVNFFTDAVNSGNYSNADSVMKAGSKIYNQQEKVVESLHNKGIREEVQSCQMKSVKEVDSSTVKIISKESILVTYSDGTSKVIDQSYEYRCEKTADGWVFTQMNEVGS